MILPENISCALDMLESAGHEAWVVGGCVRDSLMGIIPHDYDITTSALPAETEQVFAGYRLIETGLKHGTVTVLADGSPIEITTYRVDGEYRDSRRPERVTFTRNIRDDVSRRDFTMNGIAYNPKQGYFDEFGGAEDIKAGVIRCIGKPEKRFREDALRILRGLRFSASLGFEIEENTARAMHDTRELLNKISAERVFSELCGLLTGRNSHRNIFRVLTEFRDIAAVIIPEFRECSGFVQHSRFHCFDVYEHCVMSAQKAAEISADSECRLPLTLAMLLHDIGKPQRFTLGEDGEGHFYGHAAVSADIAEDILRRLKCSNALRERVCGIVIGDRLRVAAALRTELLRIEHLAEIHVFNNAYGTTCRQIPVVHLGYCLCGVSVDGAGLYRGLHCLDAGAYSVKQILSLLRQHCAVWFEEHVVVEPYIKVSRSVLN